MMDFYTPGSFVRSKAGHDKGRYLIVTREEREFVFLADGEYRTTESPKRKKKKHVQPIRQKLPGEGPWTNEEIKRAIRRLKKESLNV